jgi:hypothetical protein
MAESQYSADSASLPLPRLHSGVPGSGLDISVRCTAFPASSVNNGSTALAAYGPADVANICAGESARCGCNLSDRGPSGMNWPLSGLSPTSTSIN